MGAKMIFIDPQVVFDLASQGLNITTLAKSVGVSRDTFTRRMRDNTAIAEAYKNGKAASIQVVENTLFQMATSGKNVVATIFYLKNAAPEQYKDVHEHAHTGSISINIGQITRPERTINE